MSIILESPAIIIGSVKIHTEVIDGDQVLDQVRVYLGNGTGNYVEANYISTIGNRNLYEAEIVFDNIDKLNLTARVMRRGELGEQSLPFVIVHTPETTPLIVSVSSDGNNFPIESYIFA